MLKLKSNQDWNFELLNSICTEIYAINDEKYQFKIYPGQIEIISAEQMLDAYSNNGGMPIMYPSWVFGEKFVKQQEAYKRGQMGLALEIVLNSSPALVYCMEENSAIAQALVISHALIGHNYYFSNNYFFKQWTDAEGIIDYLVFAKNYIMKCEQKYGVNEVEKVLDACHALQYNSIDKYKRPHKLSVEEEKLRSIEREKYEQSQVNELWSIFNNRNKPTATPINSNEIFPKEPQENILYFLEKNAPKLKEWQREIIRIVRKISQYFYPQMNTQCQNEGTASFIHYKFMHDLYERGNITDDGMLEFYNLHTSVVRQYDYKHASTMNPYALGFAIWEDVERIAMNPTAADRSWFKGQDWVGSKDWLKVFKWGVENFKDDSFILQFLSPKVMEEFKMFYVRDDDKVSHEYMVVEAIHNENGYKKIRSALSKKYDFASKMPNIQVTKVDRWGDRSMTLEHHMADRRPLDADEVLDTLNHLAWLWGYPVRLLSIDERGEVVSVWENEIELV